jgi:Bacterial SH3 domain/PEGA domain
VVWATKHSINLQFTQFLGYNEYLMKKIFYILAPFLLVVLIFAGVLFFLSQNKSKGALQVTSAPISKVYLNGKFLGQTPLCECELKDMLTVGDYALKLVPIQVGFEPFEQKITINPKVLTVVDRSFAAQGLGSGSVINLSPLSDPKDTQISVVSFPDATQVFLDDNLQGQSPLLLKNITESDHELKLSKEGYKDKIVRIKTTPGYKLDAFIFLGINPDVAATTAASASASANLQVAKVIILQTPTGFLRVRDQASLNGSEAGQVKPGETYQLLDERADWFQIKLSSTQSGWISSQYAQKQ